MNMCHDCGSFAHSTGSPRCSGRRERAERPAPADDRIAQEAHSAIGRTLLHHESPSGGSWGGALDAQRLARILADGITPDDMLALMVKATGAAQDAAREALRGELRWLAIEARKTAEAADSLTLYRLAGELDERTRKLGA